MNAKHTPTPWKLSKYKTAVDTGDGKLCLFQSTAVCDKEGKQANAAHIVRCVNHFDNLVTALKDLTEAIELHKLNVRKDFHLLNVHACATKALYRATQEG